MMDISQDIYSLTTFMDPAVYRKMAERLDAVESIRRGLAQAKRGLGRSVDEVFDAIEKES